MKWKELDEGDWLKRPRRDKKQETPTKKPVHAANNPSQSAPPSDAPRLDPYAVWANITDFRSFTANGQFYRPEHLLSWMSIIAEATSHDLIAELAKVTYMYIPRVYREDAKSRYFTARIRIRDLHKLQQLPGLVRWELGLPARQPVEEDVKDEAASGRHELVLPINLNLANTRSLYSQKGSDEQWKAAFEALASEKDVAAVGLVGVIDYGCAVLNSQFRQNAGGATRVRSLWDQNERRRSGKDPAWKTARRFGYGRVLDRKEINAALAKLKLDSDELVVYRDLRLLHERADPSLRIKPHAHGTHVLDVAAGVVDPWTGNTDKAGGTEIVFVQLPVETIVDSSGGSLAVHLLDGVREIMGAAEDKEPLVIVISQGTHAGPHDGSSLLERALDDLLAQRPDNFAVVLGAGNAREAFHPESVDCHAQFNLPAGVTREVYLEVPASDSTDTFVEIWYSGKDSAASNLNVSVQSPGGIANSPPVEAGKAWVAERLDSAVAALLHQKRSGLGDGQMALLALSPASKPRSMRDARTTVPAGIWTIRVSNAGAVATTVDLWVERDDPLRDAPQNWPKLIGNAVSQEGTLNALATGKHTLVAGAMRRNDRRESAYSSHGPTRKGTANGNGPHVLAAADDSTALPGLRAAATRSGETWRMSGTSVAAPTLGRRLMNYMLDAESPVAREGWTEVLVKIVDADKSQDRLFSAAPKATR
jgi:hypothetical protein